MEPVRNRRNKIVVDAARLHRARARRDRGQTLIEGPHLLDEAVSAGVSIDTVFALPDDTRSREVAESENLRLTFVDGGAMALLAGTETPRGPVALIAIPDQALTSDRNLLVSCGLGDPGNVGTLVRTAAAFGWDYAYTVGSADPWSPKALRAGSGGQFQTAVSQVGGIEALSAWHTVATVVEGGRDLSEVPQTRVAVLIGEEAPGLPGDLVAAADSVITIHMPGPVESLNAASAAAIAVHELTKARSQGGGQV